MVNKLNVCTQVKNLTLKIEQETQKRNLTQNDLKAQNQQLNTLRASEKQLKQETNHLLDIKRSLEKQNQELRKSDQPLVCFCTVTEVTLMEVTDIFLSFFLFCLKGKTRHRWTNERTPGPVRG